MKRILAISLTLIMLLAALTGCAEPRNPSGNNEEQNQAGKRLPITLTIAETLPSCVAFEYSSHYDTVGHVCSNDSDSAWMSFVEFEGTEVFKLKCKSKDQAIIVYSGKLEAGSLTVYYDCGGTKTELFSLQSGEDIQSAGGYLPKDTIYIIVETSEKCSNGNLSFEVMYG